jgi:hypothetical protein
VTVLDHFVRELLLGLRSDFLRVRRVRRSVRHIAEEN